MKNLHVIGKELFITSDEEIVGKNVLAYDVLNNTVAYVTNPKGKWRKIILTTDQSLDGVQAIDDEFLEWFIKNPSCEEVEFKINYSNSVMNYSYKIIIPNLEVWKDVPELEEFIDKVDTPADFDQFTFDEGIRVGAKWQAERSYSDIDELRNDLYDKLPIGDVDAFEILKVIKNHLQKLDELCGNK